MNLTFKGFLRAYCHELTGLETDNLKKLCATVAHEQPSAAEALMVFASVQGKTEYLTTLAKGTWMQDGYSQTAGELNAFQGAVEEWLQTDEAPLRYKKVWYAYRAKKDATKNDRRVIALMRSKTIEALETSGLTVYHLCKDLRLNMGNVYAYLNKGDVSKVSKDTARMLMNHAMNSTTT